MASVSKWQGSIKKFASDLSLVLIQQNTLVSTCWAVLERETEANTISKEMMGNEGFINTDCISVKCSEKVLKTFPHLDLAKCLAYLEAWTISPY